MSIYFFVDKYSTWIHSISWASDVFEDNLWPILLSNVLSRDLHDEYSFEHSVHIFRKHFHTTFQDITSISAKELVWTRRNLTWRYISYDPMYCLYDSYGFSRKLELTEYPLYVATNWRFISGIFICRIDGEGQDNGLFCTGILREVTVRIFVFWTVYDRSLKSGQLVNHNLCLTGHIQVYRLLRQ